MLFFFFTTDNFHKLIIGGQFLPIYSKIIVSGAFFFLRRHPAEIHVIRWMTIFPNRPLQLVRLFSPYRSIGRSLCNLRNISNIRKDVSSDIQSLRGGLKKRGAAKFFFTNFEVLGYLMKLSFQSSMYLLKTLIILREIQSKSSLNL